MIRFVAEIRSVGKAGVGLRRLKTKWKPSDKWHPGRSVQLESVADRRKGALRGNACLEVFPILSNGLTGLHFRLFI